MWIEICRNRRQHRRGTVTPLAGVWIEIVKNAVSDAVASVTPRAGVWIEILIQSINSFWLESLPLRECGLKLS